jgi:cytochrome oxidase assembly protein ShyY1
LAWLTRLYSVPDFLEAMTREEKGIPIGRAAEVNLKNNHSQYIFTWYVSSEPPAWPMRDFDP